MKVKIKASISVTRCAGLAGGAEQGAQARGRAKRITATALSEEDDCRMIEIVDLLDD